MSYTAEPELGFIRVDNAEPILLRPYQTESIDQLRANIRAKIKNQILSAPTGAGKTQMGAMLLHECWQKEKRGMFIVDRISLLGQASACFDRYGIPHGIIQARHPRYRPQELIQVASIQTLARQGWPDADLMICDECFVAGTLIDTPMGKIPIEKLRAGDLVFNACGVSLISLVSRREIRRLVEIQTNHGKIIRCTPEHPIFTESGWTDATKLERGAVLFGEEDLQDLWEGIWSVDRRRDRGGGVSVAECEVLQSVLLQEAEESNAQPVGPTEGFPNTIQNWSSSKESRGERNRNDDISRDGIASIGRRMGIGRNCENIWTRRGVSKSLQDRCREFSPDDRYRNRWKQPPLLQAEGSRQK